MSEQSNEPDDYKDSSRDTAEPKTAAAPPPFDHVRVAIAVDDTRLDKRITHSQLITPQNLAAARQSPDDLICDHIGAAGKSIAETWREQIDMLADEGEGDDTETETEGDTATDAADDGRGERDHTET